MRFILVFGLEATHCNKNGITIEFQSQQYWYEQKNYTTREKQIKVRQSSCIKDNNYYNFEITSMELKRIIITYEGGARKRLHIYNRTMKDESNDQPEVEQVHCIHC